MLGFANLITLGRFMGFHGKVVVSGPSKLILTTAVENFSKISRVEAFFVQEVGLDYVLFLMKTVNSRQVRLQISPLL